ncbi:diguanylate phosphodiesterase [Polynucleobacter wuianus]|uniref:Diguanylate phosphodiesterase n=1 Tax=Polynucleobacter wuianus TaxID=1743168 RepID=A0A191UH83_9BURK|nr:MULTISPECIES: diguanylate phosphodiesterase [Polynucleobacter]ANJ00374.1 diguanylate phosphodiesterase [Polynucleobacter wuianus]MBU3552950.1 diguanylate phosphodiesterase [Polynucleobacter sp. MWH-Post4-6-1]MBU3609657.1 diguanylate phosphodiesterase [Polynucleobacter wuianus]
MSPKSRLYTLVKAWKNKPFQEVRDACGAPWLGLSSQALEEHQSWSKRQAISHEPIFNRKGTKLTGSLFRPLLTASDMQLLRLFMEGLDTISYWYRSGRFIPGILPIPTHAIASSAYVDALSDLILNSRLPVGLVALGMQSLPEPELADSCKEGLLRMRRLGVLLHLMNFSGSSEQLHWVEEMQMEGIHLDMGHLREQTLSHDVLAKIRRSPYSSTQIYASNVGLVKDLENASDWQIDHCYGGLMMSSISRHQMLQINDSRIAKAIFSLHPHQQLNPNGDK